MNNESLNERLEKLETMFSILSTKVDNDLKKVVEQSLPDKIKTDILEAVGLDGLVEKALENSVPIQEIKRISRITHETKKDLFTTKVENRTLKQDADFKKYGVDPYRIKVDGLESELRTMTEKLIALKKQHELVLNNIQAQVLELFKYLYSKDSEFTMFSDTMSAIDKALQQAIAANRESEINPVMTVNNEIVTVYRQDIENQGEITIFMKDFKRKAYRDMLENYGISRNSLARLLDVSPNTPDRIKGRIQDYMAEKHPSIPVHVKIRLSRYGIKGDDVTMFFPLEETRKSNLRFFLPEKLNPWEPRIRQAILKGTANIVDKKDQTH